MSTISSRSIIDRFGVEIEVVFAFHQGQLLHVLHQRGLTSRHLVRKISRKTRANIGIKNTPTNMDAASRPSHRGWVLRKDPHDRDDWQHRPSGDFRAGTTQRYRTYWAEPLEMVHNILREHALTIDVELSSHGRDRRYDQWKVSNDASLVPLSRRQKLEAFGNRISADEEDDWDTTGVELVSPPMSADDPASFDKIANYLAVLSGDSSTPYGISSSKYAGLHVHIGFCRMAEAELLLHTIQHLAYMLVQFEPIIVSCFPRSRNGQHTSSHLTANTTQSNRAVILEALRKSDGQDPTLQDLAFAIFTTGSVPAVRALMHRESWFRGYQVNFLNIADASVMSFMQKRTIEFRLHESTTDAREVEMWARFCLAFCRAAELQAMRSTDYDGQTMASTVRSHITERSKYKLQNLDDDVALEDLLNLLELDGELRDYWEVRFDEFANDETVQMPSPPLVDPFSPGSSTSSDDAEMA